MAQVPEDQIASIHQQIGKKLQDVRAAKGYLSAASFAEEFEFLPKDYEAYEKGEELITLKGLLQIMEGLDIELTELFSEIIQTH